MSKKGMEGEGRGKEDGKEKGDGREREGRQ
jgi:hypothetical protein